MGAKGKKNKNTTSPTPPKRMSNNELILREKAQKEKSNE